MTVPDQSELWGDKTYSDGATRVPLVAARCKSQASASSKAHVCKMHHSHVGEHRCICGNRWPSVVPKGTPGVAS